MGTLQYSVSLPERLTPTGPWLVHRYCLSELLMRLLCRSAMGIVTPGFCPVQVGYITLSTRG